MQKNKNTLKNRAGKGKDKLIRRGGKGCSEK
jgi:hypothetical protein